MNMNVQLANINTFTQWVYNNRLENACFVKCIRYIVHPGIIYKRCNFSHGNYFASFSEQESFFLIIFNKKCKNFVTWIYLWYYTIVKMNNLSLNENCVIECIRWY